MGLDQALMARARDSGEAVLRIYTWSRPTLSLGRNQAALGRIDTSRAEARGVDLVRRPTGGRALLHHREVTYSVTAPLAREASPRSWHRAINAMLLGGLRSIGIPAGMAVPSGRTPRPGTASCFQRPDEGEIVVGGRKLVGSALLVEHGALLQHGSILLEDDQGLLLDLLPADEEASEPAGTVRESLGRIPDVAEIAGALIGALRPVVAQEPEALVVDVGLGQAADACAAQYASREWTFRL